MSTGSVRAAALPFRLLSKCLKKLLCTLPVDGADDIIYLIRTSYRGANSYHNSNRLTFKRLPNFLATATGLLTLRMGGALLQPPFEKETTSYVALVDANATTIELTPGGVPGSALSHFKVEEHGWPAPRTVAAGSTVSLPFPRTVNRTTVTVADGQTTYTISCERATPAALTVTGSGFHVDGFQNGAVAWLNRHYVWQHVPAALSDYRFTRINGGAGTKGAAAANIHAKVLEDCVIYATVGLEQAAAQQALVAAGWEATTLTVSYTDAKDTKLKLFRKQAKLGESFDVSQKDAGWYGVTLVFP